MSLFLVPHGWIRNEMPPTLCPPHKLRMFQHYCTTSLHLRQVSHCFVPDNLLRVCKCPLQKAESLFTCSNAATKLPKPVKSTSLKVRKISTIPSVTAKLFTWFHFFSDGVHCSNVCGRGWRYENWMNHHYQCMQEPPWKRTSWTNTLFKELTFKIVSDASEKTFN